MVRTIEGASIVWSSDGSEQKIGHRPQATGHRKSKATAKPFTTETHHGGLAARRHGEIGGKDKVKSKSKTREQPRTHRQNLSPRRTQRSTEVSTGEDKPEAIHGTPGPWQATGHRKSKATAKPFTTETRRPTTAGLQHGTTERNRGKDKVKSKSKTREQPRIQRQNLSPRRTQRSTEVSREIFGISSVGLNSEEG